jgi:hypothetical protein
MKKVAQTFALLFWLMLSLVLSVTAQDLAPSPWYLIIHEEESDTLRWINADGEQAAIPRPIPASETTFLGLRVSPNSRYMVMLSIFQSGNQGISIYDFNLGVFLRFHEAQAGETVVLGAENIFSSNSQYFALGFYSGDFSNPAWRLILFDSATGNAQAFIDNTHPDAPEASLSAPFVKYIGGIYVHFQLIPQAVGAASVWPAFAWQALGYDAANPIISQSPYEQANADILPLTGEITNSYFDALYPAAPQNGPVPNFNAIGRGIPSIGGALTVVHVDSGRYHLQSLWAKAGEWILFYSTDQLNNAYWSIILANAAPGANSLLPIDADFEKAYGTSDGYILVNSNNAIFFSNGFSANTAQNIYNASPKSKIVYLTPIGISPTLSQIGNAANTVQTPIVSQTPNPVVTNCSLAPESRVAVGIQARVTLTMGGLNLRQSPGGTIIRTLNPGATFNIIGGPVCFSDLNWWQVQRDAEIGYVAEGDNSNYYIEAYNGPWSDGLVEVTPSPTPNIGNPPLDVSPTPTPFNEVVAPVEPENDCNLAPEQRLSVGGTATATLDVNLRSAPNGDVLPYTIYAGMTVTVIGGPECAGGFRWWLVSATVAFNGQPTVVQGWVSEGRRAGRAFRPT